MSKPSIPDLPSEQVSAILEFVREHGIRSAHYVGNADQGLIEGLSGVLGKDSVSIMDMANRWGGGTRFFWHEFENSGVEFPVCPEWLEGIACYQEGAPEHDLALRDWPWDSSDQLERIVQFTSRPPARFIIIFGDGDQCFVGIEGVFESGEWERRSIVRPMPFRHPAYAWEVCGNLKIGRWKGRLPSKTDIENSRT